MAEQEENIIDAANRSVLNWKELWAYRELFYFFTWRDIKIKYKQTVLGFLWAVLQPLLMMTIFTLFFGRALNIPSQNLDYPVFVFSGLLVWNTFSIGLSNASNSMVTNASIIKKIYFPRIIIPVSSILVSVFDFAVAFTLFLPVLLFYNQSVDVALIWCWPLGIFLSALASLGLGSWLSALNVKYRDFRYIIPFFIQVMFFVTPVLYPVSMLEHRWLKYLLVASPLYSAIELFRWPLTGVVPDVMFIFVSLCSSLVFLIVGLVYFKKTEDFFADFA